MYVHEVNLADQYGRMTRKNINRSPKPTLTRKFGVVHPYRSYITFFPLVFAMAFLKTNAGSLSHDQPTLHCQQPGIKSILCYNFHRTCGYAPL